VPLSAAEIRLTAAMFKKLQHKFSEFRQADRKGAWVIEQWKWRYFTFRHKKQARLNLAFDREHGIETAEEIPLESAGVPPTEVARGNGVYRPVTQKLFRAAIASIGVDAARFTFVDIGSGKGKVLFMAADLPFKRVVGIEYAGGLHEVAVRNVAAYRSAKQKCRDIEAVHADALQYDLPDGPLILFIFNALAKEIMRGLLKKLDAGVASERNRPLILIYTNVRSVTEVGGVFDGLQNLRVIRKARNFVIIANHAGAAQGA
jgi:SAM-dependent methyltransferase